MRLKMIISQHLGFTILGFTSSFVAFVLNAILLFIMWCERSFKAQRYLVFGLNISRIILCGVTCVFWIVWDMFYGRAIEKAIFKIQRSSYWIYTFNSLLFTLDRLLEAVFPIRYKTLPLGITHKVSIAMTSFLGILSALVFSVFTKDIKHQGYFTLVLDAICFVAHPAAYYYINKKVHGRMQLAKHIGSIGAFGREFDKFSNTKVVKIGSFVAFCSMLTCIADISLIFIQINLPANMTRMPTAILTLFCTILYCLQAIVCAMLALNFSFFTWKKQTSWFDKRQSWKFL